MKKLAAAAVCLMVLIPFARAGTDYLWAYADWVSSGAVQSALEYTAPVKLTEEELSIFRLGYACGYDSAKSLDYTLFAADGEGGNDRLTRVLIADGEDEEEKRTYIVNVESRKFHKIGCSAEKKILPENRRAVEGSFEQLVEMGYSPCGICFKNNGDK